MKNVVKEQVNAPRIQHRGLRKLGKNRCFRYEDPTLNKAMRVERGSASEKRSSEGATSTQWFRKGSRFVVDRRVLTRPTARRINCLRNGKDGLDSPSKRCRDVYGYKYSMGRAVGMTEAAVVV
jgi:hypothetical protein